MSIRPENHAVELGRILFPQIVVITNVRLDHLADIGTSLDEASRAFAQGVPRDSRVFLLPEDSPPALLAGLARRGVPVVGCSALDVDEAFRKLPYLEWKGNLQLALAVCEALGVPRDVALSGMRTVRPDFGSLKAWRIEAGNPPRAWVVVNAFAANEPESTLAAIEKARERWDLGGQPLVGLLNLRSDRADRTDQWCRELAKTRPAFDRLFVTGGGTAAALLRLRRTYAGSVAGLRNRRPEGVLEEIAAVEPDGGALLGFGNIAGAGGALVEHCERMGEAL
jgi:poly-gamma-glutamate synthase PgsB/CapB